MYRCSRLLPVEPVNKSNQPPFVNTHETIVYRQRHPGSIPGTRRSDQMEAPP